MLAQERQWLDPPRDEVEADERRRFEPICTTCDGQGVVCPVCRGMRWVRIATAPVGSDRRVQPCDGCMGAVAGEGRASGSRSKQAETIERFLRERQVYLPPFDSLDPELRTEDDEELRRRDRDEASFDDLERQRTAAAHHQRWQEISGADRVAARRQQRSAGQRLANLDTEAAQLDEQMQARYGDTTGLQQLVIAAARAGAQLTGQKPERQTERKQRSKRP